MKYESPITYHSKDMANVKVFADRQTGQKLYALDLSIRCIKTGHQHFHQDESFHTCFAFLMREDFIHAIIFLQVSNLKCFE
jgi:hypothetical protein